MTAPAIAIERKSAAEGVSGVPARDPGARARELAPAFAGRAARHDAEASFPFENFADLDRAGLLNLTVAREYGGEGAGLGVAADVIQSVASGDPSTALVLAMQFLHHAGQARRPSWPEPVYRKITRASLSGVALINSARVEPELGTPARGGLPVSVARRIDGGWRLSGRKIYTTGAPILRFFSVWAATDEPEPRVGAFLVEAGSAGLEVQKTWDHLGLRASGSEDLVLRDVFVPEGETSDLRPPAEPAPPDAAGLAWNAVLLGSIYNGIAIAALDWLSENLWERQPTNLGAPLATLPRFQSAVGEIDRLVTANGSLLRHLSEDVDGAASVSGSRPGLVKVTVTQNALAAVKAALELTGNPGLSRANPLQRHYRDVLCGPVHTPQDDSVLLGAGRSLLLARRPASTGGD